MKGNNGIVRHTLGQGSLDHLEECVGLGLSINDHLSAKVPMTRVFRVGLTHVEAFDVGGVTTEFLLQLDGVVVEEE